MTGVWIEFEYARRAPDLDELDLSPSERVDLGRETVEYLLNKGQEMLVLTDPASNAGLLNDREIRHMRDVKRLTQSVMWLYKFTLLIFVMSLLMVLKRRRSRLLLPYLLVAGGLISLTLVTLMMAFVFLAWDQFFAGFHQLFFEEGTWLFYAEDTIIRLFPEVFWIDTAAAIILITAIGSVVFSIVPKFTKLWEN